MVKNVWNQNEEKIINEERDLKWKLGSGDGDKETSTCVPSHAMAFAVLFKSVQDKKLGSIVCEKKQG